jgi:hypothetical protein
MVLTVTDNQTFFLVQNSSYTLPSTTSLVVKSTFDIPLCCE